MVIVVEVLTWLSPETCFGFQINLKQKTEPNDRAFIVRQFSMFSIFSFSCVFQLNQADLDVRQMALAVEVNR